MRVFNVRNPAKFGCFSSINDKTINNNLPRWGIFEPNFRWPLAAKLLIRSKNVFCAVLARISCIIAQSLMEIERHMSASENKVWCFFTLFFSFYVRKLCWSTSVRPSVCPSVCPSVTRWHPIKTAEYIAMLSSPHDSPFILVLCTPRSSRNSDGVTPCGGAKYRWGIKFARFSTKSRYISQTIQDIAMVAMEGE